MNASDRQLASGHASATPILEDGTPAAGETPRRRRRWPWVLLILALGVGGYVYYQGQQAVPEVEAAPAEPVERIMRLSGFDVATVSPQTLQETIRISGSLVPGRQVVLTSQVGGKVLTIDVQTGDAVAEGDVIATLDTQDLLIQIDQQRNAIAATQAQLDLARMQLNSATTLAEREIGSRASLESAQSNFDAISANLAAQEGQLRSIELTLEKATITAPFSGIVAARNVETQQTVGAGTAVVTLVDISRMELQAVAPISSADALAPGQAVSVTIEGLRGRTEMAEVHRISPVAIEGTRSIPVYITLDNASGVLRGGMFATGNVIVALREDAIAVPSTAIRRDAEGPHVLVIADGRLERRAVEVVETWNGGRITELGSGLAEGELFVSARLEELQPGMAVSVAGR